MSDDTNIIEQRVNVQIEPILVRRVDAARLLNVSPRLFDDLVLAGLIGRVRIGGVVAFDPADLRAFVRQAKREQWSAGEIKMMVEKGKRHRTVGDRYRQVIDREEMYRALPTLTVRG